MEINCPLFPVSIVDTPSIMMLFCPPPPSRKTPPAMAVPVWAMAPGTSVANPAKLRLAIGRFSTDSVVTVKARSPLAAWIIGASALTFTVSPSPPTDSVIVCTTTRSPGLTSTPVRRKVLNPSSVTSTV